MGKGNNYNRNNTICNRIYMVRIPIYTRDIVAKKWLKLSS